MAISKPLLGIAGIGLALAMVPWLGLPAFYESFLYLVCHWVILAMSWNILSGYSGYFSFGHGAYFGIGIYTSAWLTANANWPFFATVPLAMVLCALLGVALGAVVFRVKAVRGELFALLTLAITFVVATIILNTRVDGGPGISLAGVSIPKLGPSAASSIYLMAVVGAVLTAFAAWRVYESKLGLGLFAIHDDEDVAEVMGVPTYRYKLAAFAISCALAGLAGSIHALFVNYVTVGETFGITVPLTVVLMSVLGSSRHWAGPALGALVITCLMYAFTAGNSAVLGRAAFGAVLVAVILFMPSGLMTWLQGLVRRKQGPSPAAQARSGQPAAGTGSGATIATDLIAGRGLPVRSLSQNHSKIPLEPLLEVKGLAKHFTGVKALDGVDVRVYPGEILGLLGPNGSGKSTFINVVSGHYAATSGQVRFAGKDLSAAPAHAIAAAGIARTYQIPRPFAQMTVLQNVVLVGMFGSAHLSRAQAESEAWMWLEFTGLKDKALALPEELNLHQRKFLELARALAARPTLVLLDEVLSGLTPSEIQGAVALIRKIREQGATIVFVEHVMHAVMALVDRIVVLNHGQLLAEGPPQEVMRDPAVVKAYLGGAIERAAQPGGAETSHAGGNAHA